jgi:hypothetical protein
MFVTTQQLGMTLTTPPLMRQIGAERWQLAAGRAAII